MPALRRLADSGSSHSMANRFRDRRFRLFQRLISALPRPVRIIDVGGTSRFWELRGCAGNTDYQVTTLNLEAEKQRAGNIMPVIGDATHLSAFGDHSFDVAFSNSVIEHLATPSKQASMAEEIQRVAVAHWVQTPNYWFPIEPHFHVPGWQWMPQSLRVAVLRRFRCGWRGPCPDAIVAQRMVAEIRLLTYRELRRLFPNSTILPERFLGVTKSWIVVGGFVQLQTSLSGQSPAS